MKILINSITVLVLLGMILTFVGLNKSINHQNFRRGCPIEKALSSLDEKPDRILYKDGQEILLYAQFIPPGTIEYRFNNGKFLRKEYVPNKSPSEYL